MSKNKTKSGVKGKKLNAPQLKREIFRLFKRHPKKQFNPKQVVKRLKVTNSKDAAEAAIQKLIQEGVVTANDDNHFQIIPKSSAQQGNKASGKSGEYTGTVDMTRSGSAYIVLDEEEMDDDVYVSQKHMNTALHKDKVRVRVWFPKGRRKPEGEVLEVVERATKNYIGTITVFKDHAILAADGRIPMDIIVDKKDLNGARTGEKVVVNIIRWTDDRMQVPVGKVKTVLGAAGSNDIEMKSILIQNGFDISFPDKVLTESNELPSEISEAEAIARRDFRDVTTFTIDPDTAKDFDDGLSFRLLDDGLIEVGIHIADVTHYVKENTALDKEAFERSTSVYLVDRVAPMLPERISNELCSLRPHEDKLVFSAVFVMDKHAAVRRRWFGKAIIHSDRRFTYGEAQKRLETGEGDFAHELRGLNELALKLRARRFKKGAINFESDEVKFVLDENGVPVDVYIKERKEANMLVEDFMLLANREVATYIDKKKKDENKEIPFVYRVHDEPDPDRVMELALFAKQMGFDMDVSTPEAVGKSYNRMVKAAQRDEKLKLLQPIAIRTMAKAEYSSDNIGHYGLGFDFYSHFTSPIRRYSDVLAHRILERNLLGTFVSDQAQLEEQCKHISNQERQAIAAERESVKYKQVEYMQKHIGEVFIGYIAGIIDQGFFVELKKNHCEGMATYDSLPEAVDVNENRLSFRGLRSGNVWKMGDEVMVKIVSTDLVKRRIDMAWVEMAPEDIEVFE